MKFKTGNPKRALTPSQRVERARAALAKHPEAVGGSGTGNSTTFHACCLVLRHGVTEEEAWALILEYNQRCDPPWELEHCKDEDSLLRIFASAVKSVGSESKVAAPYSQKSSAPRTATPRPAEVDFVAVAEAFGGDASVDEDSFRKASPAKELDGLGTVAKLFNEMDLLSIATAARLNEKGKWHPANGGYLRRARIVLKGEAQTILSSDYNPKSGAWVRVNAVKVGTSGASDADVKEYRHLVIESDSLERPLQLRVLNRLLELGLPAAMILHSGGRSYHCWVRIDAPDPEAFKAVAARVFALPLGLDQSTKKPSQLSRLPGVMRGDKLQECIFLNPGAVPLTEETLTRIEAAVAEAVAKITPPIVEAVEAVKAEGVESVGEVVTASPSPEVPAVKAGGDDDLMRVRYLFDVQRPPPGDESELIKDRFLCRGGGALLIGQTGKGKSSLAMQAMLSFSIGRALFGITPNGPLKCLLVQAENDDGDLTEARDGVEWATMGVDEDDETRAMMRGNTMVVSENSLVGERMFTVLGKRLAVFKPDLLIIDPALSFTEGDTSASRDVGRFLRQQLNPLLSAHQCGCLLIHHTPKPSSDKRAVNHSGSSYAGLGSAEWANWARAVLTVEELGGGRFKLHAPKRGGRLGWRDSEGNPAYFKTLEHSTNEAGFCWQEVTGAAGFPESEGKPCKPGLPQLVELVPLSSMIHKASLVVKMQGAGFAEKWGRDVLAAALDDGTLFEWKVRRKGKKAGVGIARFEQPTEDESTDDNPF